jgi:predicted kinase
MKTVYLLKGLPASGKSTWAKQKLAENPGGIKRVNKDELRATLDGGHWSRGNEQFVLRLRDHLILEALKEGKHVIVDDTNLHARHETRIRQIIREAGEEARVEVVFFDVPLEECIRRDLARPHSVGERVIKKMYNEFLAPKRPEGYCQQDASLPRAILCDLDGTLALLNGRDPYDASTCEQDVLNEPVALVVRTFGATHTILFLSGRSEKHRAETERWLLRHGFPVDRLWMRAEGDHRKDAVMKRELYEEHVQGKFFVEFVLDDRNQVVDLWRELGLPCFQVAEGDF